MKSHAARWFLLFAILLLPALVLTGCCDDCDDTLVVVDNGPPSAPDGVFSVTGDGYVELYWNPNPEPDIAGYVVYYNYTPTGWYTPLATVPAYQTEYIIDEVNPGDPFGNGITIFFAVLAFDEDGLESELSYEVIDTPRPEGCCLVLYDRFLGQPSLSGYDFSTLSGTAQAWNDPDTDVYFGYVNGVNMLFVAYPQYVDVQDYGLIDLVDVDWAPDIGWSPSKQVELITGHSYIVRISDGKGGFNYAKVYVAEVNPSSVTLDWAYQTAVDNPELSPRRGGAFK